MKLLVRLLCIICLFVSSLSAGDAGRETPFSIGAGARALGMGGGFVSLADDASAIYYNPARLPLIDYQEFSFMHIELFEGTNYNYAGWVFPDSKLGGFGIGFFRIGTDDIERRINSISNGTFGYSQTQILFSYGQTLNDNISFGGSFKVVNQSLDSLSDYGLGFDVGLSVELSEHLSSGLIFRDMVPAELELSSVKESAPLTIAGGIGIKNITLFTGTLLNAAIELEKIEKRSTKVHAGGEFLFQNKYAVRAGYDKDNIAFGTGMVLNRVKIDYAYKILNNINDSHRFSLSFLIGTSVKDKISHEEKLAEIRGSTFLAEDHVRQFEFYKDKADLYNESSKFDSALAYYNRALAFEAQNEEVLASIAIIENSLVQEQNSEFEHLQLQKETEIARVSYLAQAQKFYYKKYYNAALDMIEIILEISPEYTEALDLKARIENNMDTELQNNFARANQALKNGKNIEAVTIYNQILNIDPENKKALEGISKISKDLSITQQLNTGIQLYNNGKIRAAQRTFNSILAIDNENLVAIEYINKISNSSLIETTLTDLQSDKKIWALYLDGLKFMRDNEYQKAIDVWRLVLKEYPNNINTLNNITQAKLRLSSEKK